MNQQEQFKKNNDLFKLFMEQVLAFPELSQDIPENAEVIFLPEHDPELCQANLQLAKQSKAEGKEVIYVKISLVPETRTVFVPKMELAKLA
jgi:hypothetical protein